MKNDYENIPVFVFSCGERTKDFCIYCLKRLGFLNITNIDSDTSFYQKLIQFSDIAYNFKSDFYVRVDADRFVFSGILDLIEKTQKLNLDNSEGICFDFLMNKTRHGTPHIYSRTLIEKIKDGNIKILNNNKPESHIMQQISNRHSFNILTNLHDYEQYPSKIINTLINRLYRNHSGHYDWNRLRNIGFTKEVNEVFKFYNNNKVKTDCDHLDIFKKFDRNITNISSNDFSKLYDFYLKVYTKKEIK